MTIPANLPESFGPLASLDWAPITHGRSGAHVWRILLGDGNSVFLKTEELHPLGELPGEIERLSWLTRMGFKAPRVIDAEQSADRVWLLMSAVPGEDLTHYPDRPDEFVRIYAQGLKRIHALDPTNCTFDHGIDARLALAAQRLAAGLVDETDFDAQRLGRPPADLLAWLHDNRPEVGTPIVTHGDASTPNVLALAGRFSGLVDCGRMGVADVWQDLAIAARSIADNIGEEHVPKFFRAYGAEFNPHRYEFYCTLDEFF
ncbi:APH(3') family aminoglycoside O-phosphotransferase [Devosia sp. FJ2-5-3]|uniref:APH(3') family aminoglycoside O-phosphotransferase n=1 Tax=Devosia sp. FJ2-5-3 TaxID=2976680 RepID=UPI0023D82DAD|nr:APH(3') family aminoglycoside O-phosphotransferase [Devosia sp. FJ2-5-3]WEJ56867.1 aminoglycoside 3'-phosphotransferase [Devosia sp. FJ2-5-3]